MIEALNLKIPNDKLNQAAFSEFNNKIPRGSLETAGKVLQNINAIFRYAEGKGLCSSNPAIAAKELLPQRREHSQRPALLTFDALGDSFLQRMLVEANMRAPLKRR